jgi:hypothetical protein
MGHSKDPPHANTKPFSFYGAEGGMGGGGAPAYCTVPDACTEPSVTPSEEQVTVAVPRHIRPVTASRSGRLTHTT